MSYGPNENRFWLRGVISSLQTLPIVLIPLGMVLYGLYCWITVGDFLAFLHVQQHSGRYLAWPWQGIVQAFIALFVIPQPFGSSNEAHFLLDLCATLGFILLIILGWRRLRMSYNLWMVFTIVYILLYPALDKPDILLSNQRFVLELFPAFMTLAVIGNSETESSSGTCPDFSYVACNSEYCVSYESLGGMKEYKGARFINCAYISGKRLNGLWWRACRSFIQNSQDTLTFFD